MTLNLGDKFDTSNCTAMNGMFNSVGAYSPIFELDLGDKFDTSNVTNMRLMFQSIGYGNPNFNLNLGTKFDTSKVTNMYGMFQNVKLRSLDISMFNTSKVTDMTKMFSSSYQLGTIYVSDLWSVENVTAYENMFFNSSKIVGGKGTVYDSNNVGISYAKVDEGQSSPGYLTLKV